MYSEQFELHAKIEDLHWWFVARRAIIGSLLEVVINPSQERLLVEIGMGTGGNLRAFESSYSCVGIEINDSAIDFARQRLSRALICKGDALTTHASHVQEADAVMLLDVLEHIEHDQSFLKGVLGLMKPGAFLVITVPACPWLWSPHDIYHFHFRRYLPNTLRALWDGEAVNERLLSFFNSRMYPIVRAVRFWNNLRGTTHGDARTDLSVPPKLLNGILEKVFRGEGKHLIRTLHNSGKSGYSRGVSLIALLEKR